MAPAGTVKLAGTLAGPAGHGGRVQLELLHGRRLPGNGRPRRRQAEGGGYRHRGAGADFHYIAHQAAGVAAAHLEVSVGQALVRLRAFAYGRDRTLDSGSKRRSCPEAALRCCQRRAGSRSLRPPFCERR